MTPWTGSGIGASRYGDAPSSAPFPQTVLWAAADTALGDWGNNAVTYIAALGICLGGWVRAHQRGWRPNGRASGL
jgi:hypothetical protein